MALTHPLPDAVVDMVATRFRVLGEPVRIRLLERLRRGDSTAAELAMVTGTAAQEVAAHIRVLLEAGMIERRAQASAAVYRLADDAVFELCEQVCGTLEEQIVALGGLVAGGRR